MQQSYAETYWTDICLVIAFLKQVAMWNIQTGRDLEELHISGASLAMSRVPIRQISLGAAIGNSQLMNYNVRYSDHHALNLKISQTFLRVCFN